MVVGKSRQRPTESGLSPLAPDGTLKPVASRGRRPGGRGARPAPPAPPAAAPRPPTTDPYVCPNSEVGRVFV